MTKDKKILAVIPTYNVEKTVASVLRNIPKKIDKLVVDNSSTDGTVKIAKKFDTTIIKHKKNLGKGTSLRDGFRYAINEGFDIVVTIDGDGEHSPKEIPRFLNKIKNNDIAVGQRRIFRSKKRRFLNRWCQFWFNLIIPGVKDIQCGFRATRVSLLKKMNLKSRDFEIEIEMLLEAAKNKARIDKFYIKTKPLKRGHLTSLDYLKINNFFDRWILRNYRYLNINPFKKGLLVLASLFGLVSGSMLSLIFRGVK